MKSFVFALLALPVIVSCDNDDASLTETADREIALGLSLDKRTSSRASIGNDMLDGEKYIINGDYAIIMDMPQYAGQVHCCRFGTSVLDNGRRGNIYLVENSSLAAAPLKWSNISPVTSFDFTIDNLGYANESAYNAASGFMEWTDEDKTVTYAAQKEWYDGSGIPKHTNDIIWGSGTARYSNEGKDVSYAELTHRMTRVSVAFVNLTEQQKIMTVKLTNLVLKPESFNRVDGTVAIAENPKREDYMLFSKENGDELDVIRDDTAEDTYLEHVTTNYILPPQALSEDHWPEIVVTYTDETGKTREVRGLIPHDILNEDGNTWEALDGLNAGNHLTIVAEIKDEIPDIVFTAKVRKWINLGPVTVSAGPDKGTPGIRNMEELKRCIELYNDLPQFKDLPNSWDAATWNQRLTHFGELMQYGNCIKDNNGCASWTFYIDFDLSAVPEKDLPQTGFRYMLWGLLQDANTLGQYTYPLTLVYNPNPGNDIANQLLKGEKGIYNIEDLNTFIKAVNEQNVWFLTFFSTINSWTADKVELKVKIKDHLSGVPFKIDQQKLAGLIFEEKDEKGNLIREIPVKIILDNPNDFTLNGEENIGELIGIQ